jgi:TPR repeat protein
MPEADIIRPVSASTPMLSPEATLRAIFTQAFATQAFARAPLTLPPGATAAILREAMAMEPARIAEIFQDVKFRARLPGIARAADRKRFARRFGIGAMAILGVAILAVTITFGLRGSPHRLAPSPPPVATARLYDAALRDKTAFGLLANRAASGDAAAQFDLATLLDSNLLRAETSTAKDDAAAFRWYGKAAKAGFAAAQNNLAFAYQTGHGVALNDALAATWFQAAAKTGLANAQNSLGYLTQNGLGVPRNDMLAVQWFQKAAAQGLAAAQNNLGAAYESGRGVARDPTQAASWFARAAAQSEPNAENSLGYLVFTGQGVTPDAGQACQWFAAAAGQGLAPAEVNLGLCYARGVGLGQDNIRAAEWFLRAQANGDGDGATALAALSPPLTAAQLTEAKSAAQELHPATAPE